MMDKEKIKAEIKRRIVFQKECIKNSYRLTGKPEEEIILEYKRLLFFIDTLDAKEVDLEKEIGEYLSTYWPNEKELHPFLGHTAKHFFELGLKAQKGE